MSWGRKIRSLAKPEKASALIRRHLEGSGSGYELDDLVHEWVDDPDKDQVIECILNINNDYTLSGEPPFGVYKPEAREALLRLAEQLESEGR
jgi:hypothetical protein